MQIRKYYGVAFAQQCILASGERNNEGQANSFRCPSLNHEALKPVLLQRWHCIQLWNASVLHFAHRKTDCMSQTRTRNHDL